MERNDLYTLATRILDVMDSYETADNGATVEDVADTILNDSNAIIEMLLSMIEDYQA